MHNMKKVVYLISVTLLLSCASGTDEKTIIEKEYYQNGKLKTLTYHFKKDEVKVFKFLENGNLDCIYNISNDNHDNLMIVFDGENNLIMIEPNKNDQHTGTSIWFDGNGEITEEREYKNGKLIK